jgi:hypothetical protein
MDQQDEYEFLQQFDEPYSDWTKTTVANIDKIPSEHLQRLVKSHYSQWLRMHAPAPRDGKVGRCKK